MGMEKEEEEEKRGPIFRDIRRYICEYCGISRSKKSLLTSHLLSHHPQEMDNINNNNKIPNTNTIDNNRSCEECGLSFKKPAHLKQHLLSHSFQCVKHWIPNTVLQNAMRLSNPKLFLIGLVSGWATSCEAPSSQASHTHSFERPFVCPLNDCNSSYRRKDHLNRHILQHQGKLFKCPVENCDKEFAIQGNVSRHIKEFHKDRPVESHDGKEHNQHICKEIGCGKEFKFASQLQKHAESHVLESSEVFCADPSCMKPFSNVKCLRAHMKSCHQYLECEVCGSKHLRKNYKRHLKTHEDHQTTTIKCSFEGCDHSFTTKSNLQQHVKAVHLNLRPFMCSIPGCGLTFAFKHVRDNHEKSSCHVYVPGDLEEFDEQLRTRPRGGRKRKISCIEMLMRKRVTPPSHCDSVLNDSSEFMLWCLSDNDS